MDAGLERPTDVKFNRLGGNPLASGEAGNGRGHERSFWQGRNAADDIRTRLQIRPPGLFGKTGVGTTGCGGGCD